MIELGRETKSMGGPQHLTQLPVELWPLLFKAAGSVAGSAISLAYLLPRGRREALTRLGVGVAAGLVFGGPAGVKIADALDIVHLLSFAETNLMGAAAASLCAWGALGWGVRIARSRGAGI